MDAPPAIAPNAPAPVAPKPKLLCALLSSADLSLPPRLLPAGVLLPPAKAQCQAEGNARSRTSSTKDSTCEVAEARHT